MDFLDCCIGEPHEEPVNNVSGRVFDSNALTIDHLTSTPLFDAILQGDWGGADYLLEPGSFRLPEMPELPEEFNVAPPISSVEDQAATWVVCSDEKGKYLWRQLPLHAAICYGAPLETIRRLVKIYPDGLCSADTDGKLPLHLAIQFHSSECVVLYLLKAFPEALLAESGDGKLPLQCGTAGLKDEAALSRVQLLQTFMDCKETLLAKDCESQQKELEVMSSSATTASNELGQAKKELQAMKEAAAATKTTAPPRRRRLHLGIGSWRKRSSKMRPA